jgi:two-component system, NarL family, response regulator NreC
VDLLLGELATYRILVAEDDDEFLAAVETVLEADGRFAVAGRARNGREAVEIAGRLQIDAIVMDIEMPELDGVEATRQLQEQQPDVPVIAISGTDYEERVLEIRDAGAVDYVRKARVDEDLADALIAAIPARVVSQ